MEEKMTVTLLPARKHIRKNKDEERPKLRVAAYCRVSTDSDEQATSYDAQIEHYTAYIKNRSYGLISSKRYFHVFRSMGFTPMCAKSIDI